MTSDAPALRIESLPLGPLQTNCFVVWPDDDQAAWVIDPGQGEPVLLSLIERQRLRVERVLLTHGHGDHIGGVADVLAACPGATLWAPRADAAMLSDPVLNMSAQFGLRLTAPAPDGLIDPGQSLQLGSTSWQVLDTAGHTPGGVTFYCAEAKAAIVGDALFHGSVGRCDLPGSSYVQLLDNIRRNLLSLPDDVKVYSGHGPATTVGRERRSNPYLQ